MAPDYTKLAATAERLIDGSGRQITLVKFRNVVDDVAKPWRGTATPRATSGSPKATEVSVTGTFVEPTSVEELGFMATNTEFTKRAQQIVMVSAKKAGTNDLEDFHEIIDGSVRWKILKVHLLKPGAIRLLYFIEVMQ
jgi:hypothetical protein